MLPIALSYMQDTILYTAASSDKVDVIRTTGLLFMAFGVAYLIYRWFRDR